jgi:hypothetical protein
VPAGTGLAYHSDRKVMKQKRNKIDE